MKCIGKSWKCTVIRQISTTYRLLLLKKEEVTLPKRSKGSLVLLVPVAFKSRGKVTKAKEKVTKSRGKVTKSERNQVEEQSNQIQDSDTRLRYPNTNLDTSENDLDTRLRHSGTDLDTQLRHSDTPKVSLSNKQRDMVNFCSVPRTAKEILDSIGVSMHSKNRERHIISLVAAGYLEMTNPENPTASNQKYMKVQQNRK